MSGTMQFYKCYRSITKYLGCDTALMLAELEYEYNYYKQKQQLNPGGYFASSISNIESATGLKRKRQESTIEKLVMFGLIDKHIHGVEKDTRRYFKVNLDNIKLFDDYCNSLNGKQFSYDEYKEYLDIYGTFGTILCPKDTYNSPSGTYLPNSNGTKRTERNEKFSFLDRPMG